MKSIWIAVASSIVGLGLGLLIGRAQTSPGSLRSPEVEALLDAGGRDPALSPAAGAQARVAELAQRLAERDEEVARLRARLQETSAAVAQPPDKGALVDRRVRQMAYYFDPTAWTYDNAVAASVRVTSQAERFVVAMPEADLEAFFADLWQGRLRRMVRGKVVLTDAQQAVVRSALDENLRAYRTWMHDVYRPLVEAARTPEDLEAARTAKSHKWASTWAGLNHDVTVGLSRFPKGKELVAALAPYL